jgi:hypothetical protein
MSRQREGQGEREERVREGERREGGDGWPTGWIAGTAGVKLELYTKTNGLR